MFSGDQLSFLNLFLNDQLPLGQFNETDPVVRALANAFAEPSAFNFEQLAFVAAQARIGSATDGYLDLVAQDYLGAGKFGTPSQTRWRLWPPEFRRRSSSRTGLPMSAV